MFLPGQQGDLPAFFAALANVTRLRIVARLVETGEETVTELAAALRMSQPRLSWHLRMLELGGVVKTRHLGRLTYCSVDADVIHRRLTDLEAMVAGRARPSLGSEVIG